MCALKVPDAPNSIQKGFPLKLILDKGAIDQLGENIQLVYPPFDKASFIQDSLGGIEPLGIKERGHHIANALRKHLPDTYANAIEILLKSLSPPLERTEDNGLAVLFYMPHVSFVAQYGVDPSYNQGNDPFELSMRAQYELTKRFSCEFSIRYFLIMDQERTLERLYEWMRDKDPHVRRLCSEGTRPRLPWAQKLDSFVEDPRPVIPILEHLKNDPDLYVRRSVANHVGDIAKDHLDLALDLCSRWLGNAGPELKWVIRHALRNPVKKGHPEATELRKTAK